MIIRLEQTFIETVSQLNSNFSGGERHTLAANIESKYNDIRSVIKYQEDKKSQPGAKNN